MSEQPSAPWWATLIAILLTAVASIVGTIVFLRGGASAPGAPPGIGSLLTETVTYIPHILILFGVLADIFTMEGVYSVPSLVGIMSIPANYVFKYFWRGIAETFGYVWTLATMKPGMVSPTLPTVASPQSRMANLMLGGAILSYPGCSVQGFEGLQSEYAPQTLVVTATIFSYYMFDLIANRNILDATATIVMFGVTFIAQALVIGSSCDNPNNISVYYRAAMALAEGMFMGGLSYATVQAQYSDSLPSSVINREARRRPGGGSGSGSGSGGSGSGSSGGGGGSGSGVPGSWSPGGNGSGGSCGGGNGETTGTGSQARPSSCPAGTASA